MADSGVVLWVVAVLLVLGGFAGLLLPALPGAPLIFAGLLLAAWADGFAYVGAATLTLLGVLAAASIGVDALASAVATRRFGASPRAVLGAVIGGLVGLAFGLAGIVLGPFLGAALGELSARRGLREAGWAGVGATVGLAIGVGVKLALAVTMLGVFAVARFGWQ